MLNSGTEAHEKPMKGYYKLYSISLEGYNSTMPRLIKQPTNSSFSAIFVEWYAFLPSIIDLNE